MILKGRKVYYHHIIVERAKQPTLSSGYKKQAILVKCDSELLHGTNSSRYEAFPIVADVNLGVVYFKTLNQ